MHKKRRARTQIVAQQVLKIYRPQVGLSASYAQGEKRSAIDVIAQPKRWHARNQRDVACRSTSIRSDHLFGRAMAGEKISDLVNQLTVKAAYAQDVLGSGGPTAWTIARHDGPDHLGL